MGEMTIPADIVPNTEQDVVLDTKELSQNFDALSSQDKKNPLPLSMLAYIFSRVMRSNQRTAKMKEVKTQLISLLQKDDADFEMLRRREEGLIGKITEAEIDRYFRHYLDKIEETNMLSLTDALKKNGYIDEISFDLLDDDKLKNFKLSQLDNQSAINRLMSVVERGEDVSSEDEPEDEDDDFERSGKLMSAIDSSKPILYAEIKQYIKEKGEGFEIDTKEYMNEVFEKEGFGSIDSEDFPFKIGLLEEQGEEKGIPLLHLKLVGKKGAGRYEEGEDKFIVETFGGSKKFDTLEDAYEGVADVDKKLNSKKFLDDIILSQDKHPLKNILLKYLTAERRELRLGTLEIEVSKTKEGSNENKQKWVESMRSIFNLDEGTEDMKTNNKEIKKVVKKLQKIIEFFETIDKEDLRTRIENAADSTKPILTRGQKRQLKELEEKDKKLELKIDKDKDEYAVQKRKREQQRQLEKLRQIKINQKEYFLEDEDESNFQIILDLFKSLTELSNSPNIYLKDIFEEYEVMKKDGYLTLEEEESIKETFDVKSPLSLALYKYAKELMTTSKFSGFSVGKSRIPIITADVTFNMSILLDTKPKNYQMFIRKPRAARNVSRGKKQREGRFKELRQKEERFKNPKLRAKYLGPFNLSDEKIDDYFEGRYEPLSDEEREEFENLTEELKRTEEKETEKPFDIVKIQKDFLNVKRAYNSLKAIVGGN